ncbi:MAG: ribosomal RNA small subunit methyltransferase A [Pirellulaceae bacterium]|jgi:16S rRNA (adenine1518-N6/adenine1519-N6)-dimethyltransferase|nr:ribosomal RNA small subunit methyltransferase A [Pirellulaceae bacterium]
MSRGNRQTISYLTRRFREVGLEPNRRHGQNFLIDLNLIELLARSANVGPNDVVLEIGTGMGSLTSLLAEQAAEVITVEIDEHLYQLAREELEQYENVTMLHQDALKNKNHFHPNVLDAIGTALAREPNRQFKLAANLPYNVATPILSNLLNCPFVPSSLTATIQLELAERIVARPNSKDYSSLSVWVQSLCDAEIVRVLSPGVFWPRPRVDSAIIHLNHRNDLREAIPDLTYWHDFVRVMFFHRRKFLRAVAVSAFRDKLTKGEVDEVLGTQDFGPQARSEQLTVSELFDLSEAFRQKLLDKGLATEFEF